MVKQIILSHLISCLLLLIAVASPVAAANQSRHFSRGSQEVFIANYLRASSLKNIAPLVKKSIAAGYYPGAVILAAHHGKIIYRGVFGYRRILPVASPMQFNTLFDLASLTKVVATTPAIMQLVEQGKIKLDAPAGKYWPAFNQQHKNKVTIRQLLTHTSGLSANLSSSRNVLNQIAHAKLKHSSGTVFLYSDLNFIVLAHIIQLVSGERLDHYTKQHIFNPLHMQDTYFLPPKAMKYRLAPTELINQQLRWGQVHDPLAYKMGGVAGHAGLFSTAKDLGIYAEALLNNKPLTHRRTEHFLDRLTIQNMTRVQTSANLTAKRGLGWDIDSAYASRGELFSKQSFGHTGWTGTSLWIDPTTHTWVIILTSRAHPTPAKHNQIIQDRRKIATLVAGSIYPALTPA